MTLFAVYGTFGRGQPGHGRLAGARFVGEARTAPRYRLFLVDGRWPALVPDEDGVEIPCELYEADEALLSELAHVEPPGWERATLELADGLVVDAFVGGRELAARGVDISDYGSWAEFVRSTAYQTTS